MTQANKKRTGMNDELVRLFGDVTVMLAKMLDPATLDLSANLMDQVHDAADTLLINSGKPDMQRHYVANLPSGVRVILCMWLADLGLAAKLTRQASKMHATRD